MAADDLVVEIPTDIEMGIDADGLPKTVAKDGGVQKPAEPEWSEDDRKQIETLRKERDEHARIAAERAREAAEAKAQVTSEREARTTAEKSAETNRLGKMRVEYDLLHSDHQQIQSALNANKIELSTAESDLQTALTNADYETAAKIQSKIGKLAAFEGQLETAKTRAERAISDAKAYIEQELANPPKKEDPKPEPDKPKQLSPDEWIDTVRTSVGSTVADWLKVHKEFVTDPKLHKRMLTFSENYVLNEEKPLNDPEFIKALEAKFLPKKTEVEVAENNDDGVIVVDTEPKRTSTAASVAAPVSRATTPTRSSTTNASLKVRLTPDQAAMAQSLHPNLPAEEARKKYAENLLRAQRDGKFASRE